MDSKPPLTFPALLPAVLPTDAIEVGRIADAWGIKGWFKVHAYSTPCAALMSAKCWYLQPAERGAKTFTGTLALELVQAKDHSNTLVALARGVDDRTAAEALKGARIFIARTDFPPAALDEFYWVDLIGLEVCNREGLVLGQVHDLLHAGPQTVLVLNYQEGDQTLERLIPFVNQFVDQVDLPSRRITVDWQPDY